MDWQTKEEIDSQFADINDKLDSIMRHLNIEEEELDVDDDSEPEEEASEELNI